MNGRDGSPQMPAHPWIPSGSEASSLDCTARLGSGVRRKRALEHGPRPSQGFRPAPILEAMRVRSLPTSCLALEITETAVTNLVHAVLRLTPLRDAGVRISVDDFGSGNTSLSSLPHLPLDELKVDQQFVRRSRESHNDLAIVRTIIEVAGRLDLMCVAEGVETEELYEDMVAMGFGLLQGYFVAKPLSESELVQFVQRKVR